jgi:hypothetical protein
MPCVRCWVLSDGWIVVWWWGDVGRAGNEEMKLLDGASGTEYVPTYEDKDGDWMLVGDVPWR